MKTLVTFLGKGAQGNYQLTRYRFPDGQETETRFFGLALARQQHVQHVRILGTPGSMWDSLLLENGDADKLGPEWDRLSEAVNQQRVDQALLDRLADTLNTAGTCHHDLRLIPYGHDEHQQVDILRAITDQLPGKTLILDVTHGFRHLPMLGLLSLLYLRATGQHALAGIYYGAYENKSADGLTPVLRLDGLLKLYDWIRALENFNKDGDYGSFAELFKDEQLPGELLRQAAFLERIANASLGSQKLTAAIQQINARETLSPAAQLFKPRLIERTAWHKGNNRAAREQHLAKDYLSRRDYLRAVQFGYEARISAETRHDPNDYDDRKEADDYLAGRFAHSPVEEPGNFRTLKNLRNALAHGLIDSTGGRMNEFIKKLVNDETRLRQWLSATLNRT